ncbi:hypothetical protein [Dyadobacter luticola]|uniref:hypothetical protein n=1 Tax=Dyadobacter luticola TaxID=1979387 RepID=UPI00197A943D|nr:hypothetical protein [Dyadobacter luticola]
MKISNIPAVELAKKLIQITPPELRRVLFCPGGSEAIEMAVSLAKQVTGKWKTISMRPSLVIGKDECDMIVDALSVAFGRNTV